MEATRLGRQEVKTESVRDKKRFGMAQKEIHLFIYLIANIFETKEQALSSCIGRSWELEGHH